uniref:Uncharacterized protein n=1 Tax=Lactuca sativa TaxID=4236 RepID=A0A9R1X6H5_LACSA|nr:hypothetical protein LSAT_V11C600323040 [Lactuca sativa]
MLLVQGRSSIVITKLHTTYWYVIADNCLYNDDSVEHRFRLNKAIFLRISNALETRYDFSNKNPMLEEEWVLVVYKNVRLLLGIRDTV